jgi:hypothetical protein
VSSFVAAKKARAGRPPSTCCRNSVRPEQKKWLQVSDRSALGRLHPPAWWKIHDPWNDLFPTQLR